LVLEREYADEHKTRIAPTVRSSILLFCIKAIRTMMMWLLVLCSFFCC
jgi:hypothetical protein